MVSAGRDGSLSKKRWEQPHLSRCSEEGAGSAAHLAAPSWQGQGGGPGQGSGSPRSPSSQGILATIFPWRPEGTLQGSDPPPFLPPTPAAMSGTKEETGGPSPRGHRIKRCFHMFQEIGFYTGLPPEISFFCQNMFLKQIILFNPSLLDKETKARES